jgi:hypothetical protein
VRGVKEKGEREGGREGCDKVMKRRPKGGGEGTEGGRDSPWSRRRTRERWKRESGPI